MNSYTHILVGLDISPDCAHILNKATAIARSLDAKISVAHIVEPLTFTYGGDVPIDLSQAQAVMVEQAKKRLAKIMDEVQLKPTAQYVRIGSATTELHHIVKEFGMDLIVVGCHGRHGLALLFGSTTNDVVQHANCDVLTVRV